MGLFDFITGGQDEAAKAALDKAEQAIQSIHVPGIGELSLPELQQYVQAGIITPAQAQAALVQSNAFDTISTPSAPTEAEMTALGQLQDVAGAGGMTPQMQARLTAALDQVKTQEQGQQGAIMDRFAAMGIPTSLMSAAMMSANSGQGAESANLAATQAAGEAEQSALRAMESVGTLGGQIHGQQYSEQAAKAQAQNAIDQWNAQNQTGVNLANQAATNRAGEVNLANAQDVSNKNTEASQGRTYYNAKLPQQVFEDYMNRASGLAGIYGKESDRAMQQGQQEAGLWSGILGAGTTLGAGWLQGTALAKALAGMNAAGAAGGGGGPVATADKGGLVPGEAEVSGDSRTNDKVHTLLSPGEIVVPRTIAPYPEAAKQFISHVLKNRMPIRSIHPEDLKTVIDALSMRRESA